MNESSARANLISPFKKIGIIDEEGKPTDLAYDWRDDHKYGDVCISLIEKCYPQEIRDLFHSPDVDFQKLTNWFMSQARCGEPAAKQFARFYLLLLKADLGESETVTVKKETKVKAPKTIEKKIAAKGSDKQDMDVIVTSSLPPVDANPVPQQPVRTVLNNSPELHINIQLDIIYKKLKYIDNNYQWQDAHPKRKFLTVIIA